MDVGRGTGSKLEANRVNIRCRNTLSPGDRGHSARIRPHNGSLSLADCPGDVIHIACERCALALPSAILPEEAAT